MAHPGRGPALPDIAARAREGTLDDAAIVAWRARVAGGLAALRRADLPGEATTALDEVEAAFDEIFATLLDGDRHPHFPHGWQRVVGLRVLGTIS